MEASCQRLRKVAMSVGMFLYWFSLFPLGMGLGKIGEAAEAPAGWERGMLLFGSITGTIGFPFLFISLGRMLRSAARALQPPSMGPASAA